jgi:hypothetical protein
MFLHIEQLEPSLGYRLFLRFDNGVEGLVCLRDELWGEKFEPLLDESLFQTARLDPVMRTVVWENGADLAPEFLLDLLNRQLGSAA